MLKFWIKRHKITTYIGIALSSEFNDAENDYGICPHADHHKILAIHCIVCINKCCFVKLSSLKMHADRIL